MLWLYEAFPSRADGAGGGVLDRLAWTPLTRSAWTPWRSPFGMPTTGIVMQDWKGKRLEEFEPSASACC